MKTLIVLLTLLACVDSFGSTTIEYNFNCRSSAAEVFENVLLIKGKLYFVDRNDDNVPDDTWGDLTIELPYLGYSEDVRVRGKLNVNSYRTPDVHYSSILRVTSKIEGDVYHLIKFSDKSFEQARIEIIYFFTTYSCTFDRPLKTIDI